jgi:mannose/cellobiose epimerase-like protein (N-acyl-D-glucosamine 2-epimerase family)
MHLAEACLAAFDAMKDEEFLVVARDLLVLFERKFFDGETLGERFEDDWRRTEADIELEPGHHFEWVWILAQFSRITGEDVIVPSTGLVRFAERFGVNRQTGAVYDAITAEGEVVRSSSRIWPTTERIKAALAMFELTGEDPSKTVSTSLRVIQDYHFAGCPPGLWIDQIDNEGRPLTQIVPASCLYHIFLAFSEVLRLAPAITRIESTQ